MRLKLFGERIAVKQHDEETTTASGLILAVEAGKKFQGEVMAIGSGKFMDSGVYSTNEFECWRCRPVW